MASKEKRFHQNDIERFVLEDMGSNSVNVIVTRRTEQAFWTLCRTLALIFVISLVLFFTYPSISLYFLVVISSLILLISIEPQAPLMGSRIRIFRKGVVFPDLSVKEASRFAIERIGIRYSEITKLVVRRDCIHFLVRGEEIILRAEHVPQYNRLRRSLKKAYLEYNGGDSPEKGGKELDGELFPYLMLAHGYGVMKAWDIDRLKESVHDLYLEYDEQASVNEFLAHGIRSLEDILVTSFVDGFFIMEGFSVEEVVSVVNGCLDQYGMAIKLPGSDAGIEERGVVNLPRTVIRVSEDDSLLVEGDLTAIMSRINAFLVEHELVILKQRRATVEKTGPWEFLVVRESAADRIIMDGKLSFTWI